jgi:DNA-binding CsgD family transcriptional regulator
MNRADFLRHALLTCAHNSARIAIRTSVLNWPMNSGHRRKQYDMLGRIQCFRVVRSPGLLDFIQAIIRRVFRRPPPRPTPAPPLLTRRERQVLELVGRGYTNREIADVLGIAPETVKTHIANIRAKLGLSNKAELRYWLLDHFPPNSSD